MTKTELIEKMAAQSGQSKKACEEVLKAFIDVTTNAVKDGDKVQLVGFGTFESSERAERTGRNPKTGEAMVIPGGRIVRFKVGKTFKSMM